MFWCHFPLGVSLVNLALCFTKSKNYTTRDNELILPPVSSSLFGRDFGLAWYIGGRMDDDDEVDVYGRCLHVACT